MIEYSKQQEIPSPSNAKPMVNDFLSSFESVESFNINQHDGLDSKFIFAFDCYWYFSKQDKQKPSQGRNDENNVHYGVDVRTIQQSRETYVNSFDLFQKLERFMYENGWFNVQQTKHNEATLWWVL